MLKVGVFGVGHLGKYHLNNWKEIPEVSIVGFFDPNNNNAKEVEKTYGLKRYMDEEALIAACDIIDIVTPTQYHFSVCEMAIKMGKNVFVEKPMANTIEEGKAIVNMVKEANVKLQVGHVERFNPAYTALKNASLNPLFIEVHRLAQFNPRGTEVSVIFDLMIHDIDIILSIVKSDIKNISASGVAVLTDTPDIANVRIEFNNGCVANLTSSRISMKKMRKIRLFQKDAYIGIDFLEKNTEVIKLKKPEDPETFSFDIETHQGTKTISIENPIIEHGNAIKAELSSFVNSIKNNETPLVSEIDGFLAMEVAHQILEKIGKSSSILKQGGEASNDPMPLED
ncbi:MAG: gfo/Idh/MocA family oxidoreductase [Chitinophagia bacterium]|nr:gfo/Idh/MocA family oxidoreductase [Chitinophagia bacterium]NCA29468.1 gfo/Idh/MocA family oxidoreductase [Chitinophagia bacterium]NDD15645.1 gfo/Idh/MocA family oxidoreductase [Chitinophagia bacterium]